MTRFACSGVAGRTGPAHLTVRDAMLTRPKTCGAETTVARAREMFGDDHVHALLIVGQDRLLAVVRRDDLVGSPPAVPAVQVGRLADRVVDPDLELDAVFETMTGRAVRRLAVIDDQRHLLGLLCLKRSLRGFCSDADVLARAAEMARAQPAAC